MLEFFRRLFFTSDFMPHGHRYFWRPEVLWLHVISDGLIALAYFSIPITLFYFVRKRRSMIFDWIFIMFGVFIGACGTTHVLEIIAVWHPVYRLAGLVKLITAAAALTTAVAIWWILPRRLAMPSPKQLHESNRRLEREVATRKGVEEELRRSHDKLEERGRIRTAELAEANAELRTEISARQQAEESVRASQQQLQNILDYAPIPIFLKDRAGRYLLANRSFEKVCGVPAAQLLGKTSEDFFQAEFVAASNKHNEQTFESGQAQEFEEIFSCEDGDHVFLALRFLLPGVNGAPDTLGVISRDVTEHKQAEQAIQQARKEAERANAAKSEFLSRMSHELRTPLNAILGFSQLLEMSVQTERQRANVAHIILGGKHLLGLINEVLDIARIESGRLEFTAENVSLTEVLDEAITLIRPLAEQRNVHLGPCTGAARGGGLWADRQRVKQVVLNLLSNAVKYNRPGGSVSLSCEPAAGGRLRLSVTDTGPGIAPENLGKLFVPFERLGAEHSGVEGTGIGLALSRRLIEAMGGIVGVESPPGSGSMFYLELPIARAAFRPIDAPSAERPFAAAPPAAGPTVLCIEDNLSNFSLVEQTLGTMRPTVRLLGSMQGRLGLDMASEHRPDLILLDLQLPDLSGDEVLRQLQADERTRNIPVVMVTADATKGQAQRLLALGARAYLTKPLDIRLFLHTFDDALICRT